MKVKSKMKAAIQDGDNQPYHHPILEEQMIIRFPQDIAARLSGAMEDENFEDFKIKFTDKHHATVKIFGERLNAVLVSLPTIVETHRTVDGSHLFKSADIGEILIVYRPNSAPVGVSEDFLYEHGLTPPTVDIVAKRQARQEAAKSAQAEGNPLEGIEYWEMVEIQLAALLSKDKSAKPICRHEFLEEPDVDPVILEKVLRRAGRHEFKGYSGQMIDDADIDKMSPENEPIVKIPQEILRELAPKETHEKEDLSEEEEFDITGLEEVAKDPEPAAEEEEQMESMSSEEEESSDEDGISAKIANVEKQLSVVTVALATTRNQLAGHPNEHVIARLRQQESGAVEKIDSLNRQLEDLRRQKAEQDSEGA
jgi:transcription initiation factor TFIID subunit 7